tara:strand:- start:641 stop:1360 length:720 start_codon:yes stop_codon:yes gene_type:complete
MRKGSREVKNKNFRLVNGKPLMYFTIKQAIKSKIFDNIVASTDSKKILKYAKSYGADGWFLRPTKLSSNFSSKIPVIKHALIKAEKFYNKSFKFIVDLDVSSPLRHVEDIIKAYKFFLRKKADILITASRSKKNPYFNIVEMRNKKVKIIKNTGKNIFRRQDAPKTFDMNASIYMWTRKALLNSRSLNMNKAVLYEMPAARSIDIDSKLDLKIVDFLLRSKRKKSIKNYKKNRKINRRI